MKSLQIQIKCPNCNKYCELESETLGHTLNMNDFYQNGFTIGNPEIEVDGDLEEITDIDDVETTLKSVRIECQECGNYIELEDWT
ncbi:hypothetical protein [Clostridium diolis]|uniref:hypothetical protein n=1 Tax=Clostridium diolis TaxID=223919 RepID=UPI003AF4C5CC